MVFLIKQFFSWLLVLIMVVSPVQVTMAIDVDQDSHGEHCQMPSMASTPSHDSVDTKMTHDCAMQHGDHCQDHPGCTGQISSSSLYTPNTFLVNLRASSDLKYVPASDSFLVIYPELFKRPPKS